MLFFEKRQIGTPEVPPLVVLDGTELTVCGDYRDVHKRLKKEYLRRGGLYVLHDPCGVMMNLYGKEFIRHGYGIKTFDTAVCRMGLRYDPFEYIKCDDDVTKLSAAVISGTNGSKPNDDEFIAVEKLLLSALLGYIHEHATDGERNFSILNDMLVSMETPEYADEDWKTAVDYLFESYEETEPCADFLIRYKCFKAMGLRRNRRLVNSCAKRIEPFITNQALNFMQKDELCLDRLCDGYGSTALFVGGGNLCSGLDFLIPHMYSQLFELLYERVTD